VLVLIQDHGANISGLNIPRARKMYLARLCRMHKLSDFPLSRKTLPKKKYNNEMLLLKRYKCFIPFARERKE
jgi:hypothetical protein